MCLVTEVLSSKKRQSHKDSHPYYQLFKPLDHCHCRWVFLAKEKLVELHPLQLFVGV